MSQGISRWSSGWEFQALTAKRELRSHKPQSIENKQTTKKLLQREHFPRLPPGQRLSSHSTWDTPALTRPAPTPLLGPAQPLLQAPGCSAASSSSRSPAGAGIGLLLFHPSPGHGRSLSSSCFLAVRRARSSSAQHIVPFPPELLLELQLLSHELREHRRNVSSDSWCLQAAWPHGRADPQRRLHLRTLAARHV